MRKFGLLAFILAIFLTACDDSGTSPNSEEKESSSSVQKENSSSSIKKQSSSSVTKPFSSSSAKVSSSSVVLSSSEESSNSKQSSSSNKKEISSSSSSSLNVSSSSMKTSSSSSVKKESSSSSAISSSSKKVESSSSEYVPFDHSWTLASFYEVGKDAYKQFTDTRNGRSYYYITITSSKTGKSVTVMAENLNIGAMVLGENNQNDDAKIERYCYNNDTTKCDEFGGLYQWAEMMQLPSRCNTESCTDLIQPNHRGICPEGWRLFTWDDYEIVDGYDDKFDDGIKGLCSTYGFRGTNQSGFSLTGAGLRNENGAFSGLKEKIAWFRPEEYEHDQEIRAHHGLVSASGSFPQEGHRELKTKGFSVRCTKLE